MTQYDCSLSEFTLREKKGRRHGMTVASLKCGSEKTALTRALLT